MRSFDLARDCATLEALALRTYINFNIRSVSSLVFKGALLTILMLLCHITTSVCFL